MGAVWTNVQKNVTTDSDHKKHKTGSKSLFRSSSSNECKYVYKV